MIWRAAEIARRRAEEIAKTMTREEGKTYPLPPAHESMPTVQSAPPGALFTASWTYWIARAGTA